MFERFTTDARSVIVGTQDVCRALGASEVAPVHILLAMTEEDSAVRDVLAGHGVTASSLTEALNVEEPPHPRQRRALDDDDAEALRSLGIDLAAIRRAVERQFGEGALDEEGPVPTEAAGDADDLVPTTTRRGRLRFGGRHIRFGGGARKTLELAVREAIRDRSGEIRTEHVALGLLRGEDHLVRKVLWQLSVDTRALRADLESGLRRSA